MSSFMFNFSVETREEKENDSASLQTLSETETSSEIQNNCHQKNPFGETDLRQNDDSTRKGAKEILHFNKDCDSRYPEFQTFKYGEKGEINLFSSKTIEEELKSSHPRAADLKSLHGAISNHSDLVPNVYEGGLKVWECSFDLVSYLAEKRISLSGLRVLELGCGAGLPGIFALKEEAGSVIFQDFNAEVLEHLTIPTVLANSSDCMKRCRFIAGDWGEIDANFIKDKSIDIILTSETIYNTGSVPRLHHLMRRVIKMSGTIYVAAKTHYFGVGGGTGLFEEFIKQKGEFDITTCRVIDEGLKREIMKLQPKDNFSSDTG